MFSDSVRNLLIALLFGAIGAAMWAYVHQSQLQRRRLSLRSLFWLFLASGAGINIELCFTGFWAEFRRQMD